MKITRRKKKNKKAEKEFNETLWNTLKEQYEESEVVNTVNEAVDIMEKFIDEVAHDWTDTGHQQKLEKAEKKLAKVSVAFEIIKLNLK